jgi:uncharacterized protein DUF1833
MPRELSLTARTAFNAERTDEVSVVLVTITHADLEEPIRLSSDPTVRLSDDPLRYGTRHQGAEYEFVLVSAVLPDDREGQPIGVTLAFENVARDMASIARAVVTPAQADIVLVLASSPDEIEEAYTGLRAVRGTYDAARVTFEFSRQLATKKPWPAHRMTQNRFPGLFR